MSAPPELQQYAHDLVARISAAVPLDAAYLIGSAAMGAFEPGRSDVDVVVVAPRPLDRAQKEHVVAAAETLPVPARKLELVAYARGRERYEVNFNTGELVSFDADQDPAFWFVLDRAAAEQHAVALLGPPWHEVFRPVPRGDVLAALAQALDWIETHEPDERSSLLNACRAWHWLETGDWVSKQAAARWLRGRVRKALAEAAGS